MKVILTVGVPASKKTTWTLQQCALDPHLININRDDTRQELFGPFKWGEYSFTMSNEQAVTQANKEKAIEALKMGMSVVISDTNLDPERRKVWKSLANEFDAEYEEKLFHISFHEASELDAAREMSVGQKVLNRMFSQYHSQNKDLILKHFKELYAEQWKDNDENYKFIIVDIDGTVANHKGVRSPFEWNRVDEDRPHMDIIQIVHALQQSGLRVIFVSGRDGSCENLTRRWLDKFFKDYTLFMRPAKDHRPDWVIKSEILHKIGAKPFACLDDRNQVVDTFREYDLRVLQVQPGNF